MYVCVVFMLYIVTVKNRQLMHRHKCNKPQTTSSVGTVLLRLTA